MQFITRVQWGARSPKDTPTRLDFANGVKVHYLGTAYSTGDHSSCPAYMRKLQSAHMDGNGWNDFAYNLAVCEHGHVFEGRGRNVQCAANGNGSLNRGHFAVLALVGNSGHTNPTSAQVAGLKDAIAYLRANGAGREIRGHRDGYATSCPGGPLYALVQSGALEPGTNSGGGGGATSTPYPGYLIRRGSKGSAVRTVQNALVRRGFGVGPWGADGDFGNATESAVRGFQRAVGISADGIVGPVTWARLVG